MASLSISEFKARVEQEWTDDETITAWQKYYPKLKEALAGVTDALADATNLKRGMAVLDLASGNGEPALTLARRVAPAGKVTATDLSRGMLERLKSNAAAEGVANIETKVCDAHELPFDNGSFDRVTSRFGVMFFVDIGQALSEIKRVLRPGGSVALMVWGAPAAGTYFGAPVVPYIRRLAVKADPDGPGPMRFAEPGKLAHLMGDAGFTEVSERSLNIPAPFRGSPEEFLASMMEMAKPFRTAVATLSADDQRAAQEEAYRNMRALYDGTIMNIVAPVLIVSAVRKQ